MSWDKTDKTGYDELYKDKVSELHECGSIQEYIKLFEATRIAPFYKGGTSKGYVRGLAVDTLLHAAEKKESPLPDIHVLDAGCGQGELSVYLACKGFRVTGIDISEEACRCSELLAKAIGVAERCNFQPESLEDISLADESIDFITGHASLHHFIKYADVPDAFYRVLMPGGEMFFADSFGENRFYAIFHNKDKMQRLGDVSLTKNLVENFFHDFGVILHPTDWFVMIDKLLLKLLPGKADALIRRLSFLWWHMDRLVPVSRATLYLSGAVMTHARKPEAN